MNATMRTSLAVAALAATLVSTLAGQTRWAEGDSLATRVGIFLDFDLEPSQTSVDVMQREVHAALSQTGAQFSWLMLKTETAPQTFDELAVLRFHGSCQAAKLTLVDAPLERITLGSTEMASHSPTPYSSVECDQIQKCVAGLLESFCPRDRETAFGRALGRVVAHELYHILARTADHSTSGITKAVQNSFDLVRQDFQFDKQTLARLKEKLQFRRTGVTAALSLPITPASIPLP